MAGLRHGQRESRSSLPFVVAASGILSVPLEPDIAGMGTFAGPSLVHQPLAEAESVDFSGKRVGVIGTGSTGVQLIPVVARQAGHLVGVPALAGVHAAVREVRPFEPGELDEMKSRYAEIRAATPAPAGARSARLLGAARHVSSSPPLKSASRGGPTAGHRWSNGVVGAARIGVTCSSTSRPTRWRPKLVRRGGRPDRQATRRPPRR